MMPWDLPQECQFFEVPYSLVGKYFPRIFLNGEFLRYVNEI